MVFPSMLTSDFPKELTTHTHSRQVKSFVLVPLVLAMLSTTAFASSQPDSVFIQQKQFQDSLHSLPIAGNFRFHADHVLGTSLDVVIHTERESDARRAYAAIVAEIHRLDSILSVWRSDSEISQLNAKGRHSASPELFAVIAACEQWRSKTCGAFDTRLGQLIRHWEQHSGVMTIEEPIRQALLDQLSQTTVTLDADSQTIQLPEGILLTPDAYAKGYIIDKALVSARTAVPALKGLLVDIGGDLRVWGQAPQQRSWQIGVRDAFSRADNDSASQVLALTNQAVAFSGQGARSLAGNSHLLNPQDGLPLNQVEQCVVVGQCAADADALATALAAMPPLDGMALIEQLAGYEAQMILTNDQRFQSAGWSTLVQSGQQAHSVTVAGDMPTTVSGPNGVWPAGFQARLELSIPKIAVEKYRAPYVAVWVTDAQKKRIRTLAVWGKADKWIDSNYIWWKRYGRQMDSLDSIARPSRQPGQYTLNWDGKDDNGQPVPAGNYLIHIETSREHGEHSYQSFELTTQPGAPVQELPAKAEIAGLRLSFVRSI